MMLDPKHSEKKRILKTRLENEYIQNKTLSSSRIVEISQELDELILEFMNTK